MWCWNVIADSVAIPSILSASSLHSSYPISASGKTLVTGHTESVTSTSQLRVCPLPLVAAMQSNHAHHWSCWKPRLLSAHGPWVPTSHGSSQASRLEFAISLLQWVWPDQEHMFFNASHESSDASTNFHHAQQKAVLHNREKLVDILAELLGAICCKGMWHM